MGGGGGWVVKSRIRVRVGIPSPFFVPNTNTSEVNFLIIRDPTCVRKSRGKYKFVHHG